MIKNEWWSKANTFAIKHFTVRFCLLRQFPKIGSLLLSILSSSLPLEKTFKRKNWKRRTRGTWLKQKESRGYQMMMMIQSLFKGEQDEKCWEWIELMWWLCVPLSNEGWWGWFSLSRNKKRESSQNNQEDDDDEDRMEWTGEERIRSKTSLDCQLFRSSFFSSFWLSSQSDFSCSSWWCFLKKVVVFLPPLESRVKREGWKY